MPVINNCSSRLYKRFLTMKGGISCTSLVSSARHERQPGTALTDVTPQLMLAARDGRTLCAGLSPGLPS